VAAVRHPQDHRGSRESCALARNCAGALGDALAEVMCEMVARRQYSFAPFDITGEV
jgi:hypothetical protein